MQKIAIDLSKYQKKPGKVGTEWQELAKEISTYYKKPLYWLIAPWKDQLWVVRTKFEELKKEGKPVEVLIGIFKTVKK